MKKLFYLSLVLFSFISCVKEQEIQQVKTTSARDNGFGQVEVAGLMISDEYTDNFENGFCYSNTNPDPKIGSGKIVYCAYPYTQSFKTIIADVIPGETVYVRAFAKNFSGKYYGNVIKIDIAPLNLPCTLPANQITAVNLATWNVGNAYSSPYPNYSKFQITANCKVSGGPLFYFAFFEIPESGVYTTTSFGNWGAKKVYARHYEFTEVAFTPGKEIYVVKDADGKYTVTMCDCEFMYTGGGTPYPVTIKGNFKTNW